MLTVQSPPDKRNKNDLYSTPLHCTRLLLENEKFSGSILEPACGKGAITKVLHEYNLQYTAYDIETDFFTETNQYTNIITNPPFCKSTDFLLHAKKIATNKIAFLLPINYLQSAERWDKVWQDKVFPLKTIYTFTRYLLMEEDFRADGKCKSGMTLFSWFMFQKGYQGEPTIKWLDNAKFICGKGDKLT
jgi:hypothetical protein